jgi:hypothetical protein
MIARAQSDQTEETETMDGPHRGGPDRVVSYRVAAAALHIVMALQSMKDERHE